MKKFFAIAALMCSISLTGFGKESYKLDEAAVDQIFAQAQDLSLSAANQDQLLETFGTAALAAVPAGEQTKFGYLVRAYFCGFIGLHRSYMGTDGKDLWYMYLCIPIYGGIVTFVDFWGVVFGALDINDYKNNKKFNVWIGK